jgi:hypothetical protein
MWFILLPLNILLTLVNYPLALVLPAFRTQDDYLPRWLWWFQTPDNPLLGDESYQTKPGRAPFCGATTGWKAYCNRVAWLWRNPIYGFSWGVMAFDVRPGYVIKRLEGSKPIEGSLKSDGFFLATLTNPDGSWCWQLYITHHWTETKCTKLNFGWKIWMAGDVKEGMDRQICAFTFNPVQWWKAI